MAAEFSSVLAVLSDAKYPVLVIFVIYFVFQQWQSYQRLSSFPGPFWAGLTNLWLARSVSRRRAHQDLYEVYLQYGELARVGPNTLLTSDPDLLQRMSSARSGYTKSEWYSGQKLEVDHDNVLSTLDDRVHATKRAKVAMGYSGKDIEGLEATVDEHLLAFLDLIRNKYISTSSELRPLDLARKVSFYAMDVLTDISYGHPWGCLARDEDVDKWFETAELLLPNVIMVSTIPWLARLFAIPVIGRLVMPSDKDKTGAGRLLGVVKEVVRRRFELEPHEQKFDMMGSFIRHGVDRIDAVAEAVLQIVAGTDTTATTMRVAMLYVITNPHIYKRLQAEIDSTVREGHIISDEQARKLPYLQAVIKEAARMCPPATGMLNKITPPQGDTINGRFVPGGVEIGQCLWGVERSKKVFGQDSMLYRPERWLEAKGDQLEKMEKSVALVWGYGKYSCLGKGIAYLELNKVFFELLKKFDFVLIDPTRPWKSENVGLWLQSEMFVKVTLRDES